MSKMQHQVKLEQIQLEREKLKREDQQHGRKFRNKKANTIVKALNKFLSFVGASKAIQSGQQVMHELGIREYKSSANHPESQGALKRFHQTLKTMLKTYCYQYE